jgi:hypothetical protein
MQKHTAKTIQDLIGFLPSPGAVTYVNDNLSNKEESAWSDKDYVFELACEFMGDFAKTVRELWAGTFGEEMQLDPDPQCVELGELDISTNCGRDCADAIRKTSAFLTDADFCHPDSIKPVLQGLYHQLCVLYFG